MPQLSIVNSEPLPQPSGTGAPDASALSIVRSEPIAAAPAADPGIASGLVDSLNPVPLMKHFIDSYQSAPPGTDPTLFIGKTLLKDIGAGQWNQVLEAKKAFDQGRYSEMVGHTAAALLPVLGPAAAKAGEDIGSGKPRYGTGEALGLLLPFGMKYAKEVAQTGSLAPDAAAVAAAPPLSVTVPPVARNPNPAEAAAVDFGLDRGVPVDAGTATGRPAVKAAQHLADRSIAGSLTAPRAVQAQADGLSRVGGDLAQDVNQGPAALPVDAGESVRQALDDKIAGHHGEASAAYTELRQHAAANADLPVDLRPAKLALQPIYDRLQKLWPEAQRGAGFKAIERIIEGPDTETAATVDEDLSLVKGIAREATSPSLRNVSQGLAARASAVIEPAVQKAVAAGGQAATDALAAGREATKAKYATADVLDQLSTEPQKAFAKLTAPKDGNLALLKAVADQVPDQMPNIGRAWMEQTLNKATAEGGFSRARGIWNDWNNLGLDTKRILFGANGANLTKFFQLAKKMEESPNPSGTGHTLSLATQGGALVWNPTVGVPVQIGAAALSSMLHSPTVVKMLTRGLTIPLSNKAAAVTNAAAILRAARAAAVGVPTAADSQPQPPDTTGQR